MYWRMFNPWVRRTTPWSELRRLQDEVNELFSGVGDGLRATEYPAINVYTGQDDLVVTAEIPGVDPESLDVNVVEETLTIRGARPALETDEGAEVHRRERGRGEFVRTLTLPYRVEAEKVDATCRQGILTVTLPRAEADKPRKIQVKSA
ncbi:MAG: Hsp20/alpha crystallin family protein [Planctomycetota bacterium]